MSLKNQKSKPVSETIKKKSVAVPSPDQGEVHLTVEQAIEIFYENARKAPIQQGAAIFDENMLLIRKFLLTNNKIQKDEIAALKKELDSLKKLKKA